MIPTFRAWLDTDEISKGMYDVTCINFKDEEVSIVDNRWTAVASFDQIKLMQYTGAKDDNGVEIYQNDIVEIIKTAAEPWEIEPRLVIAVEDVIHLNRCLRTGVFQSIKSLKVLGNIYENPELLERE